MRRGYLMRFERTFLVVFNALARLFGVLALLVGIAVVVSAAFFKEHRLAYAILAIVVCAIGIPCLIARRIAPDQLDRFRL